MQIILLIYNQNQLTYTSKSLFNLHIQINLYMQITLLIYT